MSDRSSNDENVLPILTEKVVVKKESSFPREWGKELSLSREANQQVRQLLVSLLTIGRVTIIFASILLADFFIVKMITWTFGDVINRNFFIGKLQFGIQSLSALGTAIAYLFYLIRALFKEASETIEEIRPSKERDSQQ